MNPMHKTLPRANKTSLRCSNSCYDNHTVRFFVNLADRRPTAALKLECNRELFKRSFLPKCLFRYRII